MIRRPRSLSSIIFMSRWLQAPLYFGLMVILCVYVYEFGIGLSHLVTSVNKLTETGIMLLALDLIDMVMIANLLIMVILGGYQTFISPLNLQNDPERPEWLDEVNAGTMKIKLALALVTISSVHLLRTFIDPSNKDFYVVMWQVVIHATLVLSAIAVALTDKLMTSSHTS
ncbi:hypothetical protein AQUSIP_14730 [Aquicella siphonis]|uniref:UPF0114 protein AQUSIP_14730 n=1 Tax=Aquicella siphonis TaxID=254247 RepID=A0A5E4PI13_9COXI|nr:TIGR00645 family protein [Aquicella siphonis]VVC76168.1 hypothetical protein AQUSIP_14730 [Aquicella siphonis]